MNDQRIKELFGAAKKETSTTPEEGFDILVMQQIRSNPARAELTVADVLGRWFPRLALAAVAVIALCIAGDFVYSASVPSPSESAAQLSIQDSAEY